MPRRRKEEWKTPVDLYTDIVRRTVGLEKILEEYSAWGYIEKIADSETLREKLRHDICRIRDVISGFLTAYNKRFPTEEE